MSISLPLTQDDRNRLVENKSDLSDQITQLNTANESSTIAVAEYLLLDIPSKKQTDKNHTDIYFYEEELKRLNGLSIPQPLQEQAFRINDSNSDARIKINDGRLIVTESSTEVVNIPIIPARGYVKSTVCGTDFDIWSRDRFGSTTSKLNGTSTFSVSSSLCKLKVTLNGVSQEVNLNDLIVLPQTLPGAALASTIQSLLNNIGTGGFTNAVCFFNEGLQTFTITSGTSGSSSNAQVIAASSADMMNLMGFDIQKQIVGKYQDNLLNVEIDGTAAEIKIADFRKCTHDATLGDNNDDLGIYWSGSGQLGYIGNERVGPLFCSGINNGKNVSQSIQAKLREVGTGGFKNAICKYFDDEKVFQIFSGTFGAGSSVQILTASDPLRDAKTLLGLNPPAEQRGNEEYFYTLDSLYNRLNTGNITVSDFIGDADRLSHSLLYLPPNGVKISADFQNFILATTKIYDDASRGRPRLYPNGNVVIDSTNKWINFCDSADVEKRANIREGSYSEGTLAFELQKALESVGDNNYTVEFDSLTHKFTISTDSGYFSILWNTGRDALNGIGNFIGFDVSADDAGSTSYTSDYEVNFGNPDFFNPVFSSQFYGNPKLTDNTVDEQSALFKEEYLLGQETTLLTALKNKTTYDNEVLLDGWETQTIDELVSVNQELDSLQLQRGAYASHISDSDPHITELNTAIDNLIPNRNNLNEVLASHAAVLNKGSENQQFIPNVDFTAGGDETLSLSIVSGLDDKRIYNYEPPYVHYATETKHIPCIFTSLFGTTLDSIPEGLPAFRVTSTRSGTPGYVFSDDEPSGEYNINSGTSASFLTTNSEPFDLSPTGTTLKIKVNDGNEQTLTFRKTVYLNVGDSFQSIVNVNSAGTLYIIRAGTHREQRVIPKDNDAFIGEVGAIMKGSRLISGSWTFDGTDYYTSVGDPITPGLQSGVLLDDITYSKYPEMLFINGTTVLARVNNKTQLGAGLWWLDYTNQRIYTRTDHSGDIVELSTSQFAFGYDATVAGGAYVPEHNPAHAFPQEPNYGGTPPTDFSFDPYDPADIYYFKPKNVVIKNLNITQYANPAQTGVIGYMRPGLDWIIQDNEVSYNRGVGIKFKGRAIVQRNNVHHNGQLGIGAGDGDRTAHEDLQEWGFYGGYGGDNALVEGNEISYNCLSECNFDARWEGGGTKFAQCFYLIVRNNYVHNNNGPGLWADFNYAHGLYERNKCEDNYQEGIMIEITWGYFGKETEVCCNICKNNGIEIAAPTSDVYGAQIMLSNSPFCNVHHNWVEAAGTYGNGITIRHETRNVDGRNIDGYDDYIHHNQIYSYGNGTNNTGWSGGQTSQFMNSDFYDPTRNKFDFNEYHVQDDTQLYWRWDKAPWNAWPPYLTFSSWQTGYSQDVSGSVDEIFTTPIFPSCVLYSTPTSPSYSTIPSIGNINVVSAAEIITLMNSIILGFIGTNATAETGKVRLTEKYGTGDVSKLEITGGTALIGLGYSAGTNYGSAGGNKLKVNIDGDTSKPAIILSTSSSPILGANLAADIQTKLQAIGTGGYSDALCTFNETTPFQTFTNQLRIVSGVTGLTSSVSVDISGTTLIISTANNKINFKEQPSTELTATLTPGAYTAASLATEIKIQLEAVGDSTYTVTYASNQYTITSNGVGGTGIFELLFWSGTNMTTSAHDVMGFYATDHTGSLSYISDGTIKNEDASSELKFDVLPLNDPVPGHAITNVRAFMDNLNFWTEIDWIDNGGGSQEDFEVNITVPPNDVVSGLAATINSEPEYQCDLGPAFLIGRTAAPFRINDGDTLIVKANGGTNQTFTFSAISGKSISGTGCKTRVYSGINDRIRISVNGGSATDIILGTQLTPEEICKKIEQEVRSLVQGTNTLQAAYSQLYCVWDGSAYGIYSGTGGTGSTVVISNALSNNGAADLKLGIMNGGTETVGSGNFVNSSFATITEVVNKINLTAAGFVASDRKVNVPPMTPSQLKLTSSLIGTGTRIQIISGTLYSRLGFDNNDDNNPVVDLTTVSSTMVINFSNQSIKSPTTYSATRGWEVDKGNVVVEYSTIDDSKIVERQGIIVTRIPTITPRKSQITTRVADVIAALTPTIYTDRRNAVTFRLNKKTGSYIKVGDEFNKQDHNNNTIQTNNDTITMINSLL